MAGFASVRSACLPRSGDRSQQSHYFLIFLSSPGRGPGLSPSRSLHPVNKHQLHESCHAQCTVWSTSHTGCRVRYHGHRSLAATQECHCDVTVMLLWRQLPWVRHAIGLLSRPGSQAPPAGVAKKANHRHDTLCASVWAPMAKAASGLTWRYSTNCVNPRLSSERLEIYTTTMRTCKEVHTQFGIPPLTFARKHGSPEQCTG